MAELHDLTALECAAGIRRREISPVEVTEHYLDRITQWNDRYGAYVTVTAELARVQAHEAEQAVLRAADPEDLPPLHGVPVPIKDLTNVAGVPCRLGSAAFADFVPSFDDHVVTRIRAAGAVLLGKTNTPEFGLSCYTESEIAPPARTPWDPARSAGGSSGGAAAAVAAGLAPVAQGNDGGGSVRIPASACGLVGLKPTRGRISNGPLAADHTGLVCHGPLARTVRDAAALLDVMAGSMPGDPYWAPPPRGTFLAAAGREPGRLRIGRFSTTVVAPAELHPACLRAYEAASELLAELGHEVEDCAPPFGPEVVSQFETVWAVGAALVPVEADQETRLLPLTRWLRDRGRKASGVEYGLALGEMQRAARRWLVASQSYDAILTPTLAQPPVGVGELRDDADPARDFENQKRFTPFTSVYNVTGQPAITLPLHWSEEGLPIGVMLAGRPAEEELLISLAAQLEAACPWHTRKPACW